MNPTIEPICRCAKPVNIPSGVTRLTVRQEQELYISTMPERYNPGEKKPRQVDDRDQSERQLTLFMPSDPLEMLIALIVECPRNRFYRDLYSWSVERSLTGPQINCILEDYNKKITKTNT